jgi:hypothetical protein
MLLALPYRKPHFQGELLVLQALIGSLSRELFQNANHAFMLKDAIALVD